VIFDPRIVTMGEMVSVLKAAGTYAGTAEK
jgi:hypothetical protein